ncbi:MAG: phosphatidylserine decarboxylase family protein [Ignavibacteria bacterium]|nr:phosphatidylserine decarboxylase family protein [Ignavibacteria bacterium]
MKIASYGINDFLFGIFFGILLIVFAFLSLSYPVLSIVLFLLGSALIFFFFIFFRDPNRSVPIVAIQDPSLVLSPADGKVIEIKEVDEDKFICSKATRISIFLSPFDVHVNRCPVSGKVLHFEYNPGKFYKAFEQKASEKNEHTFIGVENPCGRIAFKQIAGILARRIVCTIKVNDEVRAGDKIGMMKFGSRMDVFLPSDTSIFVKPGMKVLGGLTLIARLKKEFTISNI